MAPVVPFEELNRETGAIEKKKVSILYWYIRFDENILSKNTPAAKKYKEELFGPAEIHHTPTLYSDYGFFKDMGIHEDAYDLLDIHTRARMRAHYFLSNLVQLRETHLQKMKDKREARERDAKAKAEADAAKRKR
jgi:hypothetical protein